MPSFLRFTAMFDCMGALSTKRNAAPATASRPFDKDRDGFVIAGAQQFFCKRKAPEVSKKQRKVTACSRFFNDFQ